MNKNNKEIANATIHICCNASENGFFTGRATAIEILGLTIEHDDFLYGCKFTVFNKKFRLLRRQFNFSASREWVGNWCWNAYQLACSRECKDLLLYLRETGAWTATSGPTRLFDWFNSSCP